MKVKKQLFAFLLIVAFVFTSLPLSLASSHIGSTDEFFVDTSIQYIDVSAISSLFPSSEGDVSVSSVTYSYAFNQESNDIADVSLTALWSIGSVKVPVQVAGTVSAYTLSSGTTLWEGVLRGTALINDANIPALLGFSKFDDGTDIQANLTIQPTGLNAIIFSFGQQIFTESIMQEISPPVTTSAHTPTVTNSTSSEYVLKKMGYFLFPSGNYSGYAQTTRVYYNPEYKTCVLALQSHCDTLTSTFGAGSSAYLNSLYYQLDRTGAPYIAGFNYIPDSTTPTTTQLVLLSIFEDLLSLLGIPTSTINTALGNLSSSVTNLWSTAQSHVTISFSTFSNANFDSISTGMPIELQIATNNEPSGTFTATTSIEYRVYVPSDAAYASGVYYISSGERELTFDLTFSEDQSS